LECVRTKVTELARKSNARYFARSFSCLLTLVYVHHNRDWIRLLASLAMETVIVQKTTTTLMMIMMTFL